MAKMDMYLFLHGLRILTRRIVTFISRGFSQKICEQERAREKQRQEITRNTERERQVDRDRQEPQRGHILMNSARCLKLQRQLWYGCS